MGTGSSRKRATLDNAQLQKKVDSASTKMATVGALTSGSKTGSGRTRGDAQTTTVTPRREVHDMLERTKRDKEANWKELQKQYDQEHSNGSAPQEDTGHTGTFVFQAPSSNQGCSNDNVCPLCGMVTMYGIDGHPCRVCGQAFHKICLQNTRRYSEKELALVDRALSKIPGWSCEKCDNLCNLLTDHQMNEICDSFDKFDINRDASVSLEEYLGYKASVYKEAEGRDMPHEEVDFERLQFQHLDADQSGTVDYWEFLKHEAVRMLLRRTEDELVQLLSPLEVASARQVFEHLDTDKDGHISELEALVVYRSWYGFLEYVTNDTPTTSSSKLSKPSKPPGSMLKPKTESDALRTHVSVNSRIVMDADRDNNTFVTWEEFLKDKALQILSSRPNRTHCRQRKS